MPEPTLTATLRRTYGAALLACALAAASASCREEDSSSPGAGDETAASASGARSPIDSGDGTAVAGSDPSGRPELLEMLREDVGAARHPSDGGGRAWLESQEPATVHAGERARFEIVYEAGPLGIAEGGMILLQVSPFWGWSTPQVENAEAPGYTRVSFEPRQTPVATGEADEPAGGGARTPVATREERVQAREDGARTRGDGARTREDGAPTDGGDPQRPPDAAIELRPSTLDRQLLGIRVGGRALGEGERVRIVYGAGEALATVDRFAERATRIWIGVDGDGDGRRALLPDSPTVDVAAGPAARLVAHLPSAADPGSTVPLLLAALDRSGSAGVDFAGTVRLETKNLGVELPREVTFEREHRGVRRVEVRLGDTDVVRIQVEGPDGLEATSNPLAITPDAQRILWADLHGHSHFSDGTGTPEDYFRYARDAAGLDVVALTDHDHWGMLPLAKSPEMWAEIRAQVESFHQPGEFVTLLGYEWTNWVSGHRHVLYFGEQTTGEILSSVDPAYETPQLLWAALRGRDALTFAHHSAGGPVATDWSIPPDPELEPVTEVVSVHGSSEALDSPIPIYEPVAGSFVRDALERGYRLGFIGSGDSHDGHPGLAHLASPSGGMAAILADELSREAVYDALRERRVYATNGPRIVLRVALDGARMGSTLEAGEEHRLQIIVAAVAPLERVDVVRSGRRVESRRAAGRLFWSLEEELGATRAGEYVYVRAVQEDGGAAWSSPFFFE